LWPRILGARLHVNILAAHITAGDHLSRELPTVFLAAAMGRRRSLGEVVGVAQRARTPPPAGPSSVTMSSSIFEDGDGPIEGDACGISSRTFDAVGVTRVGAAMSV
jgi:hypothetical protein